MKTIEQLKQLAKNPFYKMSDAELQALKAADGRITEVVMTEDGEDSKKKESTKGNAAVKETGKLDKHSSDPTTTKV